MLNQVHVCDPVKLSEAGILARVRSSACIAREVLIFRTHYSEIQSSGCESGRI